MKDLIEKMKSVAAEMEQRWSELEESRKAKIVEVVVEEQPVPVEVAAPVTEAPVEPVVEEPVAPVESNV